MCGCCCLCLCLVFVFMCVLELQHDDETRSDPTLEICAYQCDNPPHHVDAQTGGSEGIYFD